MGWQIHKKHFLACLSIWPCDMKSFIDLHHHLPILFPILIFCLFLNIQSNSIL